MGDYANQHRGGDADYEAYFVGMDASMQQKIALTTAHFPARGRVADMGSGSGSGTFDLARLYPNLELTGVDINPVTVEYSRSKYRAGNLEFVVGDIADRVFPDESLDAILNSSVLHHVTSFNGFDVRQIKRTLRNQVAQLRSGGVIIIRDFLIPENGESIVTIDLPTDDGSETGPIAELSSAALFEPFAANFRSSENLTTGVPFERVPTNDSRRAKFSTTLRFAAEFVLRKDYRDHWDPELLEEYTYYSQQDFETAFRRESLRIVVSMPLWNPWIVNNRFEGKFAISDGNGASVHFPPTNYLIAGEKVEKEDGVMLTEVAGSELPPSFLKLNFYRHKASGTIYELAERPNRTVELLPWFESETGQLFVLAKKDFPRPIVNADPDFPNLNRANFSGYITEPISAIAPDDGKGEIVRILEERAGIEPSEVVAISDPVYYFTSPGGIDEQVRCRNIRIDRQSFATHPIENYSDFKSAGTVRELDALQVLRASHVGGMFDARLEINIYRLLNQLGRSPGAWIGEALNPSIQNAPGYVRKELEIGSGAEFEKIAESEPNFLSHRRRRFLETDSAGSALAVSELEYVVPKSLSKNTIAAIPFVRTADSIFVGIEIRDLPAPQNFTGNSRLACVPAWRLPRLISHKFDLESFVRDRFAVDFGVAALGVWELGGTYFTSAGLTPEIVYPLAVEVDAERNSAPELQFLDIGLLIESLPEMHDAHLLVTLNRLRHALK